ncbi:MAG: hypothetical protein ACI81P_001284 [Neolewinella sp.]|jgi:hypothetical protein
MSADLHTRYAAVVEVLPAVLHDGLLARIPQVTRFDSGFGLGGLSLLLLSRYRVLEQQADWNAARQVAWKCLEGIIDPDRPGGTSLIEYCEVAQFLRTHATALELEDVVNEVLPILDGLIEQRMEQCFAAGNLDPYTGAFNPALYLLLNLPGAHRLRDSWLPHLPTATELAQHDAKGQYQIPSGISHGLAFYTYFVAQYLQRYPQDQAFGALGFDYLQALELRQSSQGDPSCFYQDGGENGPGRLSLAYGDCGILFAGYRLATVIGEVQRADHFLNCLEQTALRRSVDSTGITSDNLLYGRSGAWLFFQRLHELSGRQAFAEAAAYWRQQLGDSFATSTGTLPQYPVYDYGAMKSFSLFEGAIGPPLAAYAIASDPSFLYQLFYLQ